MNSTQLRALQPFIDHIADCRAALNVAGGRLRTPICGCQVDPDTGRYQLAATCSVGDGPSDHCLVVVHAGIRVLFNGVRLPVDHLTDPELDAAVSELWGMTLSAASTSDEDFVAQLKTALHAERVTPQDDADV